MLTGEVENLLCDPLHEGENLELVQVLVHRERRRERSRKGRGRGRGEVARELTHSLALPPNRTRARISTDPSSQANPNDHHPHRHLPFPYILSRTYPRLSPQTTRSTPCSVQALVPTKPPPPLSSFHPRSLSYPFSIMAGQAPVFVMSSYSCF